MCTYCNRVFRGDGCDISSKESLLSESYYELPPWSYGGFGSHNVSAMTPGFGLVGHNVSVVPQCVGNGSQLNAVLYVSWMSYPVGVLYDTLPSLGECSTSTVDGGASESEPLSSIQQCAWSSVNPVSGLSYPDTLRPNVANDSLYIAMDVYDNANCSGLSSTMVLTMLDRCLDSGGMFPYEHMYLNGKRRRI